MRRLIPIALGLLFITVLVSAVGTAKTTDVYQSADNSALEYPTQLFSGETFLASIFPETGEIISLVPASDGSEPKFLLVTIAPETGEIISIVPKA